jgi:hypothetical protein
MKHKNCHYFVEYITKSRVPCLPSAFPAFSMQNFFGQKKWITGRKGLRNHRNIGKILSS